MRRLAAYFHDLNSFLAESPSELWHCKVTWK